MKRQLLETELSSQKLKDVKVVATIGDPLQSLRKQLYANARTLPKTELSLSIQKVQKTTSIKWRSNIVMA